MALTAAMSALADEYIRVSNRKMSFTESWTKPSSYFNDAFFPIRAVPEQDGTEDSHISWDATNRKLTMKNFGCWRGSGLETIHSTLSVIIVNSTKDITIEVKGYNVLGTYKGQTLELNGNTTFTGDGYLDINNDDSKKPCIDMCEENKLITIDGPKIEVSPWTKGGGIRGRNNTGQLHMKSGKLQFGDEKNKNRTGKLLTGMKNVTFDYGMGVQTPHGVQLNPGTHTLTYIGTDTEIGERFISLGPIEYYGFRICGQEITENNYDRINHYFGVTKGSVWFSPQTNRLILDNARIYSTTSTPTIINDTNDGLILQLIGENWFDFAGSIEREALYLKRNTTVMSFESDARLKATSSLASIRND